LKGFILVEFLVGLKWFVSS